MARPFSILIPGQCGNMFWQNLSDAFCLFLCPCLLPSDLLPVASWSVRSLMKCRFSWESLQFGPIIFPHPPFNAPFMILFFARDVPFAQRIIHCILDGPRSAVCRKRLNFFMVWRRPERQHLRPRQNGWTTSRV